MALVCISEHEGTVLITTNERSIGESKNNNNPMFVISFTDLNVHC